MNDLEDTTGLRLTTTEELLRAVELGIVDKTEARSMLGLAVKRGRFAKVQPRSAGRFSRSDRVLPFNRFSGQAKRAMVHAQETAQAEDRTTINTLDMLLALASTADFRSGGILAGLEIDEAKIVAAAGSISASPETVVEGIGPTAELKRVVERAFQLIEYPEDIGTEHLLLALAGEDGIAGAVLGGLGLSDKVLRDEIARSSRPRHR
jgi:hypothetical protein